jgi:GNAT superfamily N-acetyltransferase
MTPTISRLGVDEAAGVADLIAEAFAHLPVTSWLMPDPHARRRVLCDNFAILVDHAVEYGQIHTTEDRSAVAVWFPRDVQLPPPADYDRRLDHVCGPYVDRFRHLDHLFDKHHPAEPHHHLAFLAVRPDRQCQGLGTALLRHHHSCLDRLGMPAYLEASSRASRDLYARHGYRATEPFGTPDGSMFWPMWREPLAGDRFEGTRTR